MNYVCVPHAYLVPAQTGSRYGSSETGVIDGCKSPCRCWEPNSGLLEEQLVLLITSHLSNSFYLGFQRSESHPFLPLFSQPAVNLELFLDGTFSAQHCLPVHFSRAWMCKDSRVLKRLMSSSSTGAILFPHLQSVWIPIILYCYQYWYYQT